MTSPDIHTGLTSAQVEENRIKYGVNILTPPPSEPLWHKFLGKFKDPLIIILLIAGALSIGIACWEYYSGESGIGAFAEPLGIFIAILLAPGLAFYFEEKAGREFDLLNQVNDDEPVQVVRNGKVTEVPKKTSSLATLSYSIPAMTSRPTAPCSRPSRSTSTNLP